MVCPTAVESDAWEALQKAQAIYKVIIEDIENTLHKITPED